MTTTDRKMTRRTVIRTMAGSGGGLLLGFHIPAAIAAVVEPKPWTAPTDGMEINAWLTIDVDGAVTIRVPHSEQGQGALTSVSMMIAEELDVSWDQVRAVFADINRHVNRGQEYVVTSTHGSQLVRLQHSHIMQAGASARERLKAAAAAQWQIDRADVDAKQGELSAGNRRASYAQFATAAATIILPEEPAIKKPEDWWLLGRPTPRLDVPVKVNGSAHYTIDTRLDGMLYAAVTCCPVPWGRLRSYDATGITERKGVVAVVELKAAPEKSGNADMQNGIAVVADSWFRAKAALDLIAIDWDTGKAGKVSAETQAESARRLFDVEGELSHETGGDALGLIRASDWTVTADFHRPYETHARMEPINATVSVTDARVDVWAPAQDQSVPLQLVADQLGRDPRDVYVHTAFIGGAFGGGGSGRTGVTRQAAELSRQVGKPVKVVWAREEDIMQDKQRPPVHIRLSASLGDDGLPTAFFSRAVWFSHKGAERHGPATADTAISNMPYRIPNRRHERHNVAAHVPTTTHRAPGANQNGFVIEQFVDEMALAGDWDPLEWRLQMTKGLEPWQRVLREMQQVAGFTTDLPPGEGMGIAVVEDHNSICGACATVSVSRRGQLTIEKVIIVINSGYVINPQNAAEQLEGSVCWELSHALYGGLDLQEGRFVTNNFDTYPLMRFHQMPEVEVHFALSEDGWWGGIGEPGGPPAPPAIANAIYFATGRRIRSTPIARQDLSWS